MNLKDSLSYALEQLCKLGADKAEGSINESEKTKIRKIIISGNDKTHDNVIRRELEIIPGDIFSMKKIEDSYRRIFMIDYFENVNPQIVNVGNATNIVAIMPPNTFPKLGADRKLPNPPAEPSTKRA